MHIGCRRGILPASLSVGDLKSDCSAAFTAKETGGNEGYSTGTTFFVRVNDTPNCLLEQMAHSIFNFHRSELRVPAVLDPSNSGVASLRDDELELLAFAS